MRADTTRLLVRVLRSVIYEAKKHKWDMETLMEMLLSYKIQGLTIEEIIQACEDRNTVELKFAKAAFGIPDTLETERSGFITCPMLSVNKTLMKRNRGLLKFSYNADQEIVNFRYGDIKGNFSHANCILLSVSLNFTTKRDLLSTLSEIAIFVRWGFENTVGKTREKIHEEIKRKVIRAPWSLLQCSEETFNKYKWDNETREPCGCLIVNNNAEYTSSGKIALHFNAEWNLVVKGTSQEIEVHVPKESLSCYTDDIGCTKGRMVTYFTFKRMVKNRYIFFLENWKQVQVNIKEGNFKWETQYVLPYLGDKARAFSKGCRQLLLTTITEDRWDKCYNCFTYIFAYKDYVGIDSSLIKMTTREGHTIDLSSQEGIFVFDREKRHYMLFGIKAPSPSHKYDVGEAYKGCLTGYRITLEIFHPNS